MALFHSHHWTTIGRTFKPPRGSLKHARGVDDDDDLLLSMQYGITTVTQQCTGCGIERSYTTPGEVGDTLLVKRMP